MDPQLAPGGGENEKCQQRLRGWQEAVNQGDAPEPELPYVTLLHTLIQVGILEYIVLVYAYKIQYL